MNLQFFSSLPTCVINRIFQYNPLNLASCLLFSNPLPLHQLSKHTYSMTPLCLLWLRFLYLLKFMFFSGTKKICWNIRRQFFSHVSILDHQCHHLVKIKRLGIFLHEFNLPIKKKNWRGAMLKIFLVLNFRDYR